MAQGFRRKTDSLPTCMNCNSVLYGPYCSQCGQREAEPITFARFFKESREQIREIDFSWPRTAFALTTDPGRMVRRYLRGRRKPYAAPLPYALAASTLLAFTVLAVLESTPISAWTPWPFKAGPWRTAAVILAIYGGLFATLGVAWLQRFLHRQAGHSLLETWVFGLYVFGHLALFQILFALLGAFSSAIGLVALGAAVVLVLAFALAGFYRLAVLRTLPAALILGSSYIATIFAISAVVQIVLF